MTFDNYLRQLTQCNSTAVCLFKMISSATLPNFSIGTIILKTLYLVHFISNTRKHNHKLENRLVWWVWRKHPKTEDTLNKPSDTRKQYAAFDIHMVIHLTPIFQNIDLINFQPFWQQPILMEMDDFSCRAQEQFPFYHLSRNLIPCSAGEHQWLRSTSFFRRMLARSQIAEDESGMNLVNVGLIGLSVEEDSNGALDYDRQGSNPILTHVFRASHFKTNQHRLAKQVATI